MGRDAADQGRIVPGSRGDTGDTSRRIAVLWESRFGQILLLNPEVGELRRDQHSPGRGSARQQSRGQRGGKNRGVKPRPGCKTQPGHGAHTRGHRGGTCRGIKPGTESRQRSPWRRGWDTLTWLLSPGWKSRRDSASVAFSAAFKEDFSFLTDLPAQGMRKARSAGGNRDLGRFCGKERSTEG